MEVPQESKRQEKKIEYVNENVHNKKNFQWYQKLFLTVPVEK